MPPISVENLQHRLIAQDHSLVVRYLKENPDDAVRLREDTELKNAWETGRLYRLAAEGAIAGLSLFYAFEQSEFVSYEIGSVHVQEKLRGLGLQEFMNALQLYQTCAIEETDPDSFELFAVASRGTASLHVLANKLKMQEAAPSSALSHIRAERGLPFDKKKVVLFSKQASVEASRELLRSCHRGGSDFVTPKGEVKIRLLAPWFDEKLLELED